VHFTDTSVHLLAFHENSSPSTNNYHISSNIHFHQSGSDAHKSSSQHLVHKATCPFRQSGCALKAPNWTYVQCINGAWGGYGFQSRVLRQ